MSFAGMAHDLGHPPFGHQGEEALDECMYNYGGFEGNAQTLRLLTRIEKKLLDDQYPSGINDSGEDIRNGLNLTYRTIASILKYDLEIPFSKVERDRFHENRNEEPKAVKGYYHSESKFVEQIKKSLGGEDLPLKSIECSIIDIADDIAYSNFDLDDSFKAGFLSPLDLLYPDTRLLENVVRSVNKRTNLNLKEDDVSALLISIYGDI